MEQGRDAWLHGLRQRRNHNVAAVALANKNARIVWALLARGQEFRPDYALAGAGHVAESVCSEKRVA